MNIHTYIYINIFIYSLTYWLWLSRLFVYLTYKSKYSRDSSSINNDSKNQIIIIHRCDNSGETRIISRLASVRCPSGLAFDVEKQTCDWKTNVKNCKQVESKLVSFCAGMHKKSISSDHKHKHKKKLNLNYWKKFRLLLVAKSTSFLWK